MTKLIFHQLWSDFKKHWLGILITLVLCYFSTLFVFSFVFSLYLIDSELYLLPEAELMDHVVHSVQSNAILYFIILAGFLLSAILVSRKFPVRLLKPMYFCPADTGLKRKTLRSYFWIKVLICFLFLEGMCLLYFQTTFLFNGDFKSTLLILLSVFMILDFSMKADQGNKHAPLELDASTEGKGMSAVNIYWFCLLVLEYIILFCQSYTEFEWNVWLAGFWILAMLGNLFAAFYCIRTFLNNMISYEKLYAPQKGGDTP